MQGTKLISRKPSWMDINRTWKIVLLCYSPVFYCRITQGHALSIQADLLGWVPSRNSLCFVSSGGQEPMVPLLELYIIYPKQATKPRPWAANTPGWLPQVFAFISSHNPAFPQCGFPTTCPLFGLSIQTKLFPTKGLGRAKQPSEEGQSYLYL